MGLYSEQIAQSSSFDLDAALASALDEYMTDFTDHWGFTANAPPAWLSHDDWIEYRRVYGFAEKIGKAAASLLQKKGLGKGPIENVEEWHREAAKRQRQVDELWIQIKDKLEGPDWWKIYVALQPGHPADPRTTRDVFDTVLQIEAVGLFPYSPASTARALQDLAKHLIRYRNERTAAYLARVARCFVFDMRPELAVMARAVLDAALEDLADDAAVRQAVGSTGDVTLERRIEFCRARGIFADDEYRAAHGLRTAGRDAAHVMPGIEPDPMQIIEWLGITLHALPTEAS